MRPELIYEGSVKNVYSLGQENLFEFSDRYSIFDWGEMPDKLTQKGEALALMGTLFFEVLEKHGIRHHCIGLSDARGTVLKNIKPTKFMKVKPVQVKKPGLHPNGWYDYSFFKQRPQEGLVPLEVMFRFGVSKGSSLLKRTRIEPELLKQWDLGPLHEGMKFELPIIDFSTKLENGDRYLTHAEAREVAGLSEKEFQKLIDVNIKLAHALDDVLGSIGLELWDGKTEWAFTPERQGSRGFMLVDTIGLDELRVEKGGQVLSKEFLRQHYKEIGWHRELEDAKCQGVGYKTFVAPPPWLPLRVREKAQSLYLSFANELAHHLRGELPFGVEHTITKWLEYEV